MPCHCKCWKMSDWTFNQSLMLCNDETCKNIHSITHAAFSCYIHPVFFFCRDISFIFCWDIWSLKHFIHLSHTVTVVWKLTATVFISLYFQTFWPKWPNFFQFELFQNSFSLYDRNKQPLGLFALPSNVMPSNVSKTAVRVVCTAFKRQQTSCTAFNCCPSLVIVINYIFYKNVM